MSALISCARSASQETQRCPCGDPACLDADAVISHRQYEDISIALHPNLDGGSVRVVRDVRERLLENAEDAAWQPPYRTPVDRLRA